MAGATKNPLLRRYWFEFDVPQRRHEAGTLDGEDTFAVRACGVTAFTLDDAVGLLRERVFRDGPLPPVRVLIEDADLTDVDMLAGVPVWRGIWSCRPAPRPPRRHGAPSSTASAG